MLRGLNFYLEPTFAADEQSLDMLKTILSSWDPDVPVQNAYLTPAWEEAFTRQAYADLLRRMGQVLEGWLQGFLYPSEADGEASQRNTKRRVCVRLYDREVWKAWWGTHLKECFPTFAKSRRLHIHYFPRECYKGHRFDPYISFRLLCSFSTSRHGQLERQRLVTPGTSGTCLANRHEVSFR